MNFYVAQKYCMLSTVVSNTMAPFLVSCCLVGAYWLTSSAPVSGLSDVIDYRIVEGQPANTLIGNVPVDAGLHTMYTAQTLTSFRYRLLPTDSDIESGCYAVRGCYYLADVCLCLLGTLFVTLFENMLFISKITAKQFCKSLFTNNMVDDKKQREITEKLN